MIAEAASNAREVKAVAAARAALNMADTAAQTASGIQTRADALAVRDATAASKAADIVSASIAFGSEEEGALTALQLAATVDAAAIATAEETTLAAAAAAPVFECEVANSGALPARGPPGGQNHHEDRGTVEIGMLGGMSWQHELAVQRPVLPAPNGQVGTDAARAGQQPYIEISILYDDIDFRLPSMTVSYVVTDAHALDIPDDSFRRARPTGPATRRRPGAGLSEMRRVCKPGGLVRRTRQ